MDPLTGPQAERLSFKLASTMDSVAEVEAAAEKFTQASGLDEDESFRVVMAVREAAVNAVLHGNGYDPNKQVSASFENTGKSLVITIADQGEGGSIQRRFQTLWRRKIYCVVRVAGSS